MRVGVVTWAGAAAVALAGALTLGACDDSDSNSQANGGGGGGGGSTDTGGGGGGGGGAGAFSFNDVRISATDAPAELNKRAVEYIVGWMNCPVPDCSVAELWINGESIGTVADLGSPGVPMSDAVSASIASKLRANQDNVLKMSAGGQTTELTLRCPKMPAITAPSGPVSSGPVDVAWPAFEGVASDSGETLAESSSVVSLYAWGPVVGLGLVANKQVKATDLSANLTLPPKSENPNADSVVVSIIAAGAVVRTPQGGEGSCDQQIYRRFDWQ